MQYIRCQGSLSENEALATVVDLLVGATETVGNNCFGGNIIRNSDLYSQLL